MIELIRTTIGIFLDPKSVECQVASTNREYFPSSFRLDTYVMNHDNLGVVVVIAVSNSFLCAIFSQIWWLFSQPDSEKTTPTYRLKLNQHIVEQNRPQHIHVCDQDFFLPSAKSELQL
mmetsp:Transcript_21474/g.59690  ORF Transcript_21474/g.59690 Transcript_21474/m.59690 type:complete len:118 (-) Transcript_21474:10586-10939(-)